MPYLKHHDNSNLPGEIWKPVEGWPYSVSNMGRVRRDTAAIGTYAGRILKPADSRGYKLVYLHDGPDKSKGAHIHRLVCAAFHGPQPKDKPHAAHLSGEKEDNRPCNLKWCSISENSLHRYDHGTMVAGEGHWWTRLTASNVRQIRLMRENGARQKDIAQKFNVHPTTISDIIRRKSWKHLP